MAYALVLYMISMVILFGNFYFKTYRIGKKKEKDNEKVQNGAALKGAAQNGTKKKSN